MMKAQMEGKGKQTICMIRGQIPVIETTRVEEKC